MDYVKFAIGFVVGALIVLAAYGALESRLAKMETRSMWLAEMHGVVEQRYPHPLDTDLRDDLSDHVHRLDLRIDRLADRIGDPLAVVEGIPAERILDRLRCEMRAGKCLEWLSYGIARRAGCAERSPWDCEERFPVTEAEVEAAREE